MSQITLNIHQPIDAITETSTIRHKSGNIFCRMRQYSGLKSSSKVRERKKNFLVLKICICFSEVEVAATRRQTVSDGLGIFLFLTAIPLVLPYRSPHEEGPITVSPSNPGGRFTTKHNADCVWTFVDEDTVPLLGHFPHEMEGSDIFEIIHPQDLSIIKNAFESLVLGREHVSKPYRMKTRNSDYAIVVTSWSCFVNPWTNNLEFINGAHTIVKGPGNSNIFSEPIFDELQEKVSDDTIRMLSFFKDDIRLILQHYVRKKHISTRTSGSLPESKSILSSYLDTLRHKVATDEKVTCMVSEGKAHGNTLQHISDSHSSDSLPSYNQLRHKENMSRFFNSKPRTLSIKEIVSDILHSSTSIPADNTRDSTKTGKDIITSNSSSGSERERCDTDLRPPLLTEKLLLLHNQKMEAQMVEQYKEARGRNRTGKIESRKLLMRRSRKIPSQIINERQKTSGHRESLEQERLVPTMVLAKDEQIPKMPAFKVDDVQNILQV